MVRCRLAISLFSVSVLFGELAVAEDVCSSCGMSHTHQVDVSEREDFPFLTSHIDGKLHLDQISDADLDENEIYWSKLHLHGDLGLYLTPWLRIETRIKVEEAHEHAGCGHADHHDGHGGHGDAHHGDHDDGHDDDHGHHDRDTREDDHDDHEVHGGGHGHAGHAHGFGGDDRYFDDHVAIIEELKATVQAGPVEFFGGKFNPRVALDMHAFPGQYGYEVPEEYSILERIGVGTRGTLASETFGDVTLELATFFADTTFLNEGIGEDRQVPHSKSDGGLANTESFESFSASLYGSGWYTNIGDTIHALNWAVGTAFQDGGDETEHGSCTDETRYSVGLEYGATLTPELVARLVAEWMHADDFGGAEGSDTDFTTLGASIGYRGWELGGTVTDINRSGGEEDGNYVQASLGHVWNNGLGVHVGWKEDDREGGRRTSVGFTVSYHFAGH